MCIRDSHTIGCHAAYAATVLGAALIEKHFKMPGDKSSVDASFSMDLTELPELKSSLKSIYSAIGTPTLELPKSAKISYSGRRSLYVVEKISKERNLLLKMYVLLDLVLDYIQDI